MFQTLDVFRLASDMARHAGSRQAVIAQNIANANTPGYQARDVTPFKTLVRTDNHEAGLRATRAGHMLGSSDIASPENFTVTRSDSSPNGNGVTLEEEMLNAVDAKRQHDRALAIYRSSMTILRTTLSRS